MNQLDSGPAGYWGLGSSVCSVTPGFTTRPDLHQSAEKPVRRIRP